MGNSYEYHWEEVWIDAKTGDEYVGTLQINGRIYRLPIGYYYRLKKYHEAMRIFGGREIG